MNLAEAMAALEGRKEFAVRRNDGLVTINYVVQMPGTFDGIRRDFRGITFDEATGVCVSRPFHKFFNLNQIPETQFDRLKHLDALVFEKVDGSLVHFLKHKGEYRAATQSGTDTKHSIEAEKLTTRLGLWDRVGRMVDDGFTPMFEYVSPRFPIVLWYPTERLVFLCARNCETGNYVFSGDFDDKAERYQHRFSEIVEKATELEYAEGFVCWLEDGSVVKVKSPWYRDRSPAFDALLRPAHKLYGLVFEGVMDDLIAASEPHHKAPLERVWAEAQTDFLAETQRLQTLACEVANAHPGGLDPKTRRKAFVEIAQQRAPASLGGLMRLYDGKPADEWVQARLMERYRTLYPDPIIVGAEEI